MSGTFIVNGSNTTITFAYTKPTSAIQAIINSAVQQLVSAAEFAGMNNQQKLDTLDIYVRERIKILAKTNDIAVANAAAASTADANVIL